MLSIAVLVNDGTDDSNIFPVAVEVEEILSTKNLASSISVFPNPATNRITIDFINEYLGTMDVRVLSLDGRILRQLTFTKNTPSFKTQVDLSEIQSGVILVEFQFAETKVVQQLILK